MLIDEWKGVSQPNLMGDEEDDSNKLLPGAIDLQDVASQVNFLDVEDVEDKEGNLKTAIDFFRLYCGGILYALGNRKPEGISFQYITQGFALPKMKNQEKQRVRRIKFSGGQEESSGHPAPDPILLVCKSAAVWAKRNRWKIAASAEPEDLEGDDDNSWDTMHDIAAQDFLAKREYAAAEALTQNVIGLEVAF